MPAPEKKSRSKMGMLIHWSDVKFITFALISESVFGFPKDVISELRASFSSLYIEKARPFPYLNFLCYDVTMLVMCVSIYIM